MGVGTLTVRAISVAEGRAHPQLSSSCSSPSIPCPWPTNVALTAIGRLGIMGSL